MISIAAELALFLFAYVCFGSITIGYLLLRTTRPTIEKLAIEYKLGWASIIGLIFAILSIAMAYCLNFFVISTISISALFFILLPFSIILLAAFMYGQTPLLGKKITKIEEIPPEVESASKFFDFALDKLNLKSGLIEIEDFGAEKRAAAIDALKEKRDSEKESLKDEKIILEEEKEIAVEKTNTFETEKDKPISLEERREEQKIEKDKKKKKDIFEDEEETTINELKRIIEEQ